MCLALVAAWQSRNNSVTGTKPMWVCTCERGYVCVRTLYEGGFIISWAEGHLALIGVLRCWFWCLQHWCCLLLGIRSWLPPSPSTFPPFCLKSLCTPANTTLITVLSICLCCTPKGKEVLSFPSPFCHPFPSIPFYNLLSFPCALSSPLTSYLLLFPHWQLYFCSRRWKSWKLTLSVFFLEALSLWCLYRMSCLWAAT